MTDKTFGSALDKLAETIGGPVCDQCGKLAFADNLFCGFCGADASKTYSEVEFVSVHKMDAESYRVNNCNPAGHEYIVPNEKLPEVSQPFCTTCGTRCF